MEVGTGNYDSQKALNRGAGVWLPGACVRVVGTNALEVGFYCLAAFSSVHLPH